MRGAGREPRPEPPGPPRSAGARRAPEPPRRSRPERPRAPAQPEEVKGARLPASPRRLPGGTPARSPCTSFPVHLPCALRAPLFPFSPSPCIPSALPSVLSVHPLSRAIPADLSVHRFFLCIPAALPTAPLLLSTPFLCTPGALLPDLSLHPLSLFLPSVLPSLLSLHSLSLFLPSVLPSLLSCTPFPVQSPVHPSLTSPCTPSPSVPPRCPLHARSPHPAPVRALPAMNGSLVGSGGGWQPESVIIPLVYLIIFLVGTVGNSLVLAVLLRNGQVKNTTNLFILNLGVADLCFILFCVPFQATIYTLEGWVFGPFMCKAVHFFIYLTMYASSFTLATVSLDRYLAIRYPLHSRELRTPRNALLAICLIWGLSFIFSGPYLSYYQEFQLANLTVCHPIWEISQRKIMDICTFIFSYIIPVLILSLTYVRTIRYLWRSVDPLQDMSESKKAKRKVTRMIIIVAVLFCLCWLPHHLVILCVWFGYFPLNHSTYVLRILSHVISYANSCVNPIVYALVSKHFRKGFKKIFSCLLHKKAAHKVHVAQVANTVSTLEAELSEVTQLSEALPGRSAARCRVPAQPWGEAELVGQQQRADGSSVTFNVS